MKIKHGDVLIYSHARTYEDYKRIAEATYFGSHWSRVNAELVRASYMETTIWAWVIQNVTHQIAEDLNTALLSESSYMGLHAIDYSYPPHLALYRNSMPDYCRIIGTTCMLPYSMGNEDEIDEFETEHLLTLGFTTVEWEDIGAHGSIFDDYDTLEHFQQVRDVQAVFARGLPEGDYEAEELVMLMEALNPRLFNTLGAAVRALSRAQNEEDIAHIGISGRRYIEQLADVLFPPSDTLYNGRSVKKDKFRNRIWAFIDQSITTPTANRNEIIEQHGLEVDRLIDELNAILHGTSNKHRALKVLFDLAKISIKLLQLNPTVTRNPYYAFNDNILDLLRGSIDDDAT
ncbi:hypothetical protein [Bordetella trematum]|uniref:hypothetical protein n=1 Tax=Bordetella trematum TaxID=123899 RepID=UPI003988C83C